LENLFCGLHYPLLLRRKRENAAWRKYFASRIFEKSPPTFPISAKKSYLCAAKQMLPL
jgi:hypothetical protein